MRLAVTTRCNVKAVYRDTRRGDVLVRLDGCPLPVVLREAAKAEVPPAPSAEVSQRAAQAAGDAGSDAPRPSIIDDDGDDDDGEADGAADGEQTRPSSPPGPLPNPRLTRNNPLAASALGVAVRGGERWQFVGEVFQAVGRRDARDLDAVWKDPRNGWEKTKDFSLRGHDREHDELLDFRIS